MARRRRRRPDPFADKAKREGKAARSVYKLEEIDERWRILKSGQTVLDLGCAPGSWLTYAAGVVGKGGGVVGVDLKELNIPLPAHAEARVADVYELDAATLGGPFDVILSDMAPATMGDHKTDAIRSAGLVEHVLFVAQGHLKKGGVVVAKLLEGGDVVQIVAQMRKEYDKVERLRPKATKKASTEIFLIGLGKKT